jgi:hypothetical protein
MRRLRSQGAFGGTFGAVPGITAFTGESGLLVAAPDACAS